MFTGIIEGVGTVKSIEKKGAFGRIVVEAGALLEGTGLGDSIAVSGVCLTVTSLSGNNFSADISDETLRVTVLGELKSGDKVNLERSLTLSKPLGGHLVTGHTDGIGTIKRITPKGDTVDMEIKAGPELLAQIVKKGSVAIDGISLTVADISDSGFKVVIIPHTLKMTTLPYKKEGAKLNIETDIIGKYVEKYFSAGRKGGITEDFLSENGFFSRK